jgi:hypothetical protein
MNDQSIKDKFQQVSTRDKRAAEFFSSEKFMQECRERIDNIIINAGGDAASVHPSMALKDRDTVYIRAAFDKLKKEYPELNHARLDGHNDIIFDTQPLLDTFLDKVGRYLCSTRVISSSP